MPLGRTLHPASVTFWQSLLAGHDQMKRSIAPAAGAVKGIYQDTIRKVRIIVPEQEGQSDARPTVNTLALPTHINFSTTPFITLIISSSTALAFSPWVR